MGLVEFVRKQLIDILEWTEEDDQMLAWRYPTADREIQQGAHLVVRETQAAVLMHEGRVADVFAPGRHVLRTGNLPLLADLQHWETGFESPIKTDVVFVSTRLRLDRTWGTAAPIALRDPEFGAVRVRAFGVYAYSVVEPRRFVERVSGTRAAYPAADVEGQLRAAVVEAFAAHLGAAELPFLDMASHQDTLAAAVAAKASPAFAELGLAVERLRIASLSLPDALQQRLDERIGMGIVGDLECYARFQTARAIPDAAQAGGAAGAGLGMGVGIAMGQTMGRAVGEAVAPARPVPAAAPPASAPAACGRCGAAPTPGAGFCARCGAALG